MAQFDLKKATLRLCDGRLATLTTTAANGVNAQFTLTDKDTHRGTRTPVSIVIVVAGLSTALSVVVVGTVITVNSATDGAGLATSTPNTIKPAIEASVPANALVTVTLPGTGAAVVSAQASTPLATGARTLTLKVNEGTMSYTEKKNRKYTRDRGLLSLVMNADEEPLEAKFDVIWEFITASTGGTETVEDVLKNRGEASDWVTTDADACNPFAVDIEIEYNPNCGGAQKEFIVLEDFRYENIDHTLKEGVLAFSGKCNVTEASVYRQT